MFQQRCNKIALSFLLMVVGILNAGSASALTVGTVTVVTPANPAQVPLYGKIELNVPLTTSSTKYYEAAPAQGGVDLSAVFTAPNATTTTIKGFYNGSAWRLRFAPSMTGAWTAAVSVSDSTGTVNATTVAFSCVASASPGFAQINGKYIQFSNGTGFYAVGHNTGWQQDVEQPTAVQMAAQGENLLSFWMAAPWGLPTDSWWMRRTPIENGVGGLGNYDQNSCAYIDSVVANAEAAGIYLLPSIWAHDQLCDGTVPSGWPASWNNNAYNTICTATNFYQTTSAGVDTNQWRMQKNYYRYILARWGYSRSIVGWVGVVEIDGTTGMVNNATQANAWVAALRTYFATNDKYRLNAASTYPLYISKVDQPSYDGGANTRADDSYASKTNNYNVAATIATATATMRSSSKPCYFTEFGGDVLNGASQPAHLHNGIWAGTAAGTAGAPMLWVDGGNYPMLTPAMQSHLQIINQFIAGLDFPLNNSLTSAAPTVPTGFKAWSQQLSNKGFVWIQKTSAGSMGGQTLTISSLTAGTYSVAWYDAWTSGTVPFATTPTVTVSGTTLAVTVPALAQSDVVCRFFLNAAAPSISSVTASPNPVTSTTTLLNCVATDDGGEPVLTYTWNTVGTPPGPVTVGANGTNGAKNTLATFSTAGTYTFQVTVKDLGGRTATQNVTVNVTAVPSQGFSISPSSAVVRIFGVQQFTASALDQFGHAVAVSPVWSITPGQNISATGLFTAGSVAGGPYTVTATVSGLTATADVGVIDLPPTVSLTSPAEGTVYGSGSSVALAASASDDNIVASVAFYANGVLLGTDLASPYTLNWNNVPAGAAALTAVATDNAGHTTTSAAVNIVVNALPTVSVTAPANNAILAGGTSVTLSADASDSDGSISKVEFFVGSTLVGTTTAAPFSVAWTTPATGTFSITAKATDNSGYATVSQAVSVVIDSPPSIGITNPSAGAQYDVGAMVTITVMAADDVGIASVAFYANGALLGTASSAPYSYEWTNPAAGSYSLTAVATDTVGQTATSAGVAILVDAPPTVAITSPANNSTITAGGDVAVSAIAMDADGTVVKVEFFAGATLIGTSTTAPFAILWNNPASGVYSLTARATDDVGATTTSPAVAVTIDALPTVSITSPADGDLIATGSTITIAASATDDFGVASVAFYVNGLLLGTGTTAPYSVDLASAASGAYSLVAVVTDSAGQTATSSAVTIAVNAPPTVSVTAPASNAIFLTGSTVTLSADTDDVDGTVTQVEFYAGAELIGTATTAPHSVDWINAAAGTYSVTAKATDNLGAATISAPITVTINTPPSVSISGPAEGALLAAGSTITITANASDDVAVASVAFYANGLLLGVDTTAPYSVDLADAPSGVYALTAVATDSAGQTTQSAAVTIVVNAAPTVSVTSPANNAIYLSGTDVTLSVDAEDADGTVAQVEYFAGATSLGIMTTAPYSLAWVSPASGTYTVTAKATDNLGVATISAPITVTINTPPSVSISGPAEGALLAAGSTITITANASDDVAVASVAFYANGSLLGVDTTAPYSMDLANAQSGAYALTAVATDNLGQTTQSATVNIVVNAAPTVTITSPASGTTFATGSDVTLIANAADADGAIAQVEYFADAVSLGVVAAAPYSLVWNSPASGVYSITAKATDNLGFATTSAAVSVTINTPPSVSITGPVEGTLFATGSTISVSANANDDVAVASVAFYANGSLLGTDTTAPYSVIWNNVASGTYALTAVATDNLGQMTQSATVTVVVNTAPTVSLTAPANNAVFTAGTNVTISANAADADGTVSKVEFFAGATLIGTDTTAPYSFVWSNPAAATYSLTAKATDNRGVVTVSSAVTVIVNAPPACAITSPANNTNVNRGTTVTIVAAATDSDGTIAKVEFIDNGTVIKTDTSSPYQYSYTPAKGTHTLTARATDNRGAVTTSAAVTLTVK